MKTLGSKREVQISTINRMFRTMVAKDMSNIESLNTGSHYKTKDEILNDSIRKARKARRFVYLISSCLDYINEGGDFEGFIDMKLDNINRDDQCEQDKLDSIEELNRLSEELLEI